ncbi:MAG: hypothetical protein NZ920_04125 [Aigarchaeota archaeon]|nr:hypothetical protein [Aigarchaeota archaeon]MDW8092191.1 AN1-type zinc finger domain-containing protein [Nitrososphaerota archaeon]
MSDRVRAPRMKCSFCEKDEPLPYYCSYCRRYHCSEHRLPENHNCDGIRIMRVTVQEGPRLHKEYPRSQGRAMSLQVSSVRFRTFHFDRTEVIHLLIGCGLITVAGISLIGSPGASSDLFFLTAFGVAFAASFLVHELAHKYVAINYGHTAHFRLSLFGVLITALTALLPIKFLAPGAVMVAGSSHHRVLAKIAAAGPVTNLIISGVIALYLILIGVSGGGSLSLTGVRMLGYLNALLALFNLVPFGPLDGLKVLTGRPRVWILLFALSLLTFVSYNFRLF